MTSININLRLVTQLLIFIMIFGTILRGFVGSFYGVFEFVFLLIVLALSIFYFADKSKMYNFDYYTYSYLFFLLYLISHLFIAIITRYLMYDVSLYSFILAGFYEFKIASFAFLFPLIYFMINKNNQYKFESFLVILLKISIIYTFFEQVLSLLGFREIFLNYMQGVIHEIHNAYSTRLGMYRVFGLTGSPQLLGIFHVIGLLYMLHRKDRLWSLLGLIAVIFSTSITAYAVLIALFGLYLLYTKQYLVILISIVLSILLGLIMYQRLEHILSIAQFAEYADAHPFDLLVHQMYGYYILISNVIDPITYNQLESGPLNLVINYFNENPAELIFGKGMMYTFETRHYDLVQIHNYEIFTDKFTQESSDFYILNFFEQFGIIGIILLLLIFLILPYININNYNMHHVLVLNAFIISTFHYSPAQSPLLMIFISYSIYSIFFIPKKAKLNV